MDENAKRRAIQALMAYIDEVDIPCPDNIYAWGSKINAYCNKSLGYWYEGHVHNGVEESKEQFDARRFKEMREWITNIAQIVAHSKSDQKVKISKDYSNMFELLIEGPSWQLSYRVDREAVCEKKVTGTKVVPRRVEPERVVEEHEEEIVEWVCNDTALLDNSDNEYLGDK